jgi:hypothetical protein
MPPRLVVLSRERAEVYEPRRSEVCISITAPHDSPARLSPRFVCWVEHPEPWRVAREVIATLRPPLNLGENEGHPFCAQLSALTSEMKKKAREA